MYGGDGDTRCGIYVLNQENSNATLVCEDACIYTKKNDHSGFYIFYLNKVVITVVSFFQSLPWTIYLKCWGAMFFA